ncbi:MAG: NAD(P)/FAD-dependent oxidoreductase [Solirubrobacterales bacterium]|nr:NAD(P)/FAD-dependent oxidoreductase [Solirubrobacterales bacterium]
MDRSLEHFDVLIVGAGLSGIGAGYHLQDKCPTKSYAILEARERSGGTWDLFRYPGIRSDSDMHTLGYAFRPWDNPKAIADGGSILTYIRSTADDYGIAEKIRFNHRVRGASWSSAKARWEIEAERTDTGETVRLTCDFLLCCCGYYRYDHGFTPHFEGLERFGGRIVHPQHWSDDIDYENRRVIVIGSGATAVTLVPALAEKAAHVTMLQRSPSYVVSLPAEDELANRLRRKLPAKLAYGIVRWKNVLLMLLSFRLSRRRPELMKKLIRKGLERALPPSYDIDTHFTPRYNPWDQRMCLVPDGDLFEALSNGRASMVTDRIDAFTETGVSLASGTKLEADLIVTATGLDLVPLGGMAVTVDGREVSIAETLAYRGMMLSGIPNLAVAFGYTNASWTLKCDLTCEYVCRLLRHMDAHGYSFCIPENHDPFLAPEPFIDFSSGYVVRAIHKFPRQGPKPPWRLHQNYARDIVSLRLSRLEDGVLQFRRIPAHVAEPSSILPPTPTPTPTPHSALEHDGAAARDDGRGDVASLDVVGTADAQPDPR